MTDSGSDLVARRDEIVKLRKAGQTYPEIGRRFGISKQRVMQIVKEDRAKQKPAIAAMMSTRDVASFLNVHINTVRRWSNKGRLKSYRVSRRGDRRFWKEDVDALLKGREIG